MPSKHLPSIDVPGLDVPVQFTCARVAVAGSGAELILVHDCVPFGPDVAACVRANVERVHPAAQIVFVDSSAGVVRIVGRRPAATVVAAVAVDRVAAAWDDAEPLAISFDGGSCAVRPRFDGQAWVVNVPGAV